MKPSTMVVVASFSMVLAGCSGSSGFIAGPDDDVLEPTASAGGDGTGKIFGTVMDSQALPIEGVNVSLLSGALEHVLFVSTDVGGSYAFTQLTAGSYSLITVKAGYRDQAPAVLNLQDGQEVEFTIVLEEKPAEVPHQVSTHVKLWLTAWRADWPDQSLTTIPSGGALTFLPGNGLFQHTNNFGVNTTDDARALQGVVLEVQWTGTQYLTKELLASMWVSGKLNADTQLGHSEYTFAQQQGGNPIKVMADRARIAEIMAKGEIPCSEANHPEVPYCLMNGVVWAATGNTGLDQFDFGVALNQPIEVAVTQFYRMDAEPGFSYFG